MTESKGLTSRAFFPPGERKVIFFASRRATETRRWQSTDSARVDRELAGENWRRLAQSKGLANRASAERLGGLFGFCGRPELV